MAGLRGEQLFRLEKQGRAVGRFEAVERDGLAVCLKGWRWERGPRPAKLRGAIIRLTDSQGAEMRRWSCAAVELEGERVLATRIRRLG